MRSPAGMPKGEDFDRLLFLMKAIVKEVPNAAQVDATNAPRPWTEDLFSR